MGCDLFQELLLVPELLEPGLQKPGLQEPGLPELPHERAPLHPGVRQLWQLPGGDWHHGCRGPSLEPYHLHELCWILQLRLFQNHHEQDHRRHPLGLELLLGLELQRLGRQAELGHQRLREVSVCGFLDAFYRLGLLDRRGELQRSPQLGLLRQQQRLFRRRLRFGEPAAHPWF